MALLAVDEVMLREPRLLVPGMQPLGNVTLISEHPVAAKLKQYEVRSSGRQLKGKDLIYVGVNNERKIAYGQAYYGSALSNYYYYCAISEADHDGLFLVCQASPNVTSAGSFLSLGENASFGAFLNVGQSTTNIQAQYRRTANGTLITVTGPAFSVGLQYSIVCCVKAGILSLFVNGIDYGDGSQLSTSEATLAWYAVDGLKRDTASGCSANILSAGYGFDLAIPRNAFLDLSANIYNILRPA